MPKRRMIDPNIRYLPPKLMKRCMLIYYEIARGCGHGTELMMAAEAAGRCPGNGLSGYICS